MRLWVGLGNPGSKYEKTRHNVGAIVLRGLSPHVEYRFEKSFNSYMAEASREGQKYIYLIPQTFMNLSGDAVVRALHSFKINPEEMVVFHDEIELAPLKVVHKFDGGHKGHNGLRDIIQKTGTAGFHRIRIGVGRPENERMGVADYVLSNMPASEIPRIEDIEVVLQNAKLL